MTSPEKFPAPSWPLSLGLSSPPKTIWLEPTETETKTLRGSGRPVESKIRIYFSFFCNFKKADVILTDASTFR